MDPEDVLPSSKEASLILFLPTAGKFTNSLLKKPISHQP
jgi:hypothetical protein